MVTAIKRMSGFTLVELIVVLAIILIVAGVSVGVIINMGGEQPLRLAGKTIQITFDKAHQLAITQRHTHFLVFDAGNASMTIYKKTVRDEKMDLYRVIFDKTKDKPAEGEETIPLPKGVEFATDIISPRSLFTTCAEPAWPADRYGLVLGMPEPYLTFRSDGSITLPPGIDDIALTKPNPPDGADIVLKQPRHSGRMYIDFASYTGKIVKTVYWDGEINW